MARFSREGGMDPPKSLWRTQQNCEEEEERGRTMVPVGYCQALTYSEVGGKESRLMEQPPPNHAPSLSVMESR